VPGQTVPVGAEVGTVRNSQAALAALGVALALAGPANAGPFDRAPRDYGPSVNRRLDEAGSGLRLTLEGCPSTAECRFSSANVVVVATGRARPPRTQRIAISTDLLGDQAGVDPQDLLRDATLVFGATMAEFDPRLRPDRRNDVVSDLIGTALHQGHSEQDGAEAHYALGFDEDADGLLVIAVMPKQ
jgi:hypothetical protein